MIATPTHVIVELMDISGLPPSTTNAVLLGSEKECMEFSGRTLLKIYKGNIEYCARYLFKFSSLHHAIDNREFRGRKRHFKISL